MFLNDFLIPHQWVAGLHSRQTWRSGRLPSRNRCYSVLCLWCPLALVTACRVILNKVAMQQAIHFTLTGQCRINLFAYIFCICKGEEAFRDTGPTVSFVVRTHRPSLFVMSASFRNVSEHPTLPDATKLTNRSQVHGSIFGY